MQVKKDSTYLEWFALSWAAFSVFVCFLLFVGYLRTATA